MTILAHVGGYGQAYRADLDDGRTLLAPHLLAMAALLHRAGVTEDAVDFVRRSEWRLLTSGQQVALRAEIRNLARGGNPSRAMLQRPPTERRVASL